MLQINKYPWLVRIEGYYGDRWGSMCGGTLVASKYVITAAHCVTIRKGSSVAKPADEIRTIIGDHNLFSSGEELIQPKTVNAIAITNHPSYNGYIGGGYDISIVELEEELDLDIYTPACLAKSDDATTFDGKMATVAGWGLDANGNWPNPMVPHEVAVPVVEAGECGWSKYVPSIICAGCDGCGASAYRVNSSASNEGYPQVCNQSRRRPLLGPSLG